MLRVAMVAVLVVPLGAAWAANGQGEWVNVGLGGGGGIFTPAFSPHDPKLMFCSSDMTGVYRSTDGGRRWRMLDWRQLGTAHGAPVVFHPTDPNVLYAIHGKWAKPVIKVSRDRGRTWRPLTDQTPWSDSVPQTDQLAIGPAGRVLMVLARRGLFRSDDEGKTWAQAEGIDSQPVGIFAAGARAGEASWFAAMPDGVRVSGDAGRTWKACVNKGLPGPIRAFCGGCDPKTGKVVLYCSVPSKDVGGKFAGGIYRSDDGAATWVNAMGKGINTTVAAGGRRRVTDYAWLGMAANQTRTVYAFAYENGAAEPVHNTVYRTDDAGRTWRPMFFRDRSSKRFNVDLPWIRLDRGHGGGLCGFSVDPRDGRYVAFSDAMELYMTTDGGRTWRQAYSRCAAPPPAPGKPWASIGLEVTTTWRYFFDPHDARRSYICYTDIGFARSTDRGATWRYAAKGSPWTNTFYDLAFDPAKGGRIYAACAYEHDIPSWKMAPRLYGGGGVCVSSDFGASWKPISKGLPEVGACTAVELDTRSPPGRRTLYCSFYGGGVFKSTDGGGNWSAVNTGLRADRNNHFTDLKLHADGTLYALCGGKASPANRRLPVAPGGLFRSTDAGKSWTELTGGMNLWLPFGFDVDPADSRRLYLCVSAVPRRHDEAGVYTSADAGRTWTKLKIAWPADGPGYVHAKYPSIDPYRPGRVWVSTGTHGLFVTADGGKTWKRMAGPPFKGVNRIIVDPTDHEVIWATTFGGGVWRGPAMDTE